MSCCVRTDMSSVQGSCLVSFFSTNATLMHIYNYHNFIFYFNTGQWCWVFTFFFWTQISDVTVYWRWIQTTMGHNSLGNNCFLQKKDWNVIRYHVSFHYYEIARGNNKQGRNICILVKSKINIQLYNFKLCTVLIILVVKYGYPLSKVRWNKNIEITTKKNK
jgi:hypothetical protein